MKWTEDKKKYLTENYSRKGNVELAEYFKVSRKSVQLMAFKLGLKKDPDVYLKLRTQSQFTKGNVPFNKGLKQNSYMSKENIEKTKATRFKKGYKPHNHKPIGSERITKDGYTEIKTREPNKWELKHRMIWSKNNDLPSEGETIYFLDGNPQNIVIDNLGLKSRIKNMLENSYQNYPKEIIPTKELIVKIKNELK